MPLVALAAIGVAGAVAGAEIQSHAIGEATDKQLGANEQARLAAQQGSQQAQGILQTQQQRGSQTSAPFIAMGNQALGKLGGKAPSSFAAQFGAPTLQSGSAFGPGITNANPAQTFGGQAPTGRARPYQSAQPGMVLMVSPTGEQQQVPADQVPFFQQRGAKVLQ